MADFTDVPQAGLRPPGVRLRNWSNAVAKVAIVVAAGAELEVDDDVAKQLVGQSTAFTVVEPDAVPADEDTATAPPPAKPKTKVSKD